MGSLTLPVLMKNNTNQCQIYMIKDVKFISTKFKMSFSIEWTNKLKLKNKDKQPYV